MPNPELEQVLKQQIRGIVAERGAHLDFTNTIMRLQKERLGKKVYARVTLDGEAIQWPVGIILPLDADNTSHAVFLANGRVLFSESPIDEEPEGKEAYRTKMSGSLVWDLPSLNISHIEKTFRSHTLNFPAFLTEAFNADKDKARVAWAIRRAQAIKYKSKELGEREG